MNENPTQQMAGIDFLSYDFLLTNVGAPFIIGAAAGYFAKKMLKIALFTGGALITLMFIGEYYHIIDINDAHLQNAADSAVNSAIASGNFLVNRLTRITSKGVSAASGFFIGFKFG